MRFLRKPIVLIVLTGAIMLAVGFAGGITFGANQAAHAAGENGVINIFNNSDVVACVSAAFGCTLPEQYGVCHAEGNSDWVACDFQAQGHSGGTVHLDNPVPCNLFVPQGFTQATQDTVDWTPSGEVHLRCYFPYPPSTRG